ncbi:MAG: arginine--tRNA ligase, partial [Deltaproteobacteria bacterium]|nr:arginine--tRNA ligase [Deltaproteobacteria bacterium]
MKDPFVTAVVETLQTHLNSLGLDFPMEIAPAMVERPPNPEMGDYALPCFGLAKSLKKAPHLIAETLALSLAPVVEKENLKSHPPENQPLIAAVEAAGPYLNFRVNTARMAMRTLSAVLDGSYFTWPLVADPGEGQGKKVMVEYSQPNTHKAFHVGHMRNVALGDGLARILAYTGRSVTAVNYIGDVGTHIAKCLWFYLNHRSSLPPEKQNPPDPADPHALDRGEWLGELYTATRL